MKRAFRRGRAWSPPPQDTKEQMKFFGMAKKYLIPYKRLMVFLFVIYGLFTLMTAVQPLIMAPVLDIALSGGAPVELPPNQPLDLQHLDLNNAGKIILVKLGLTELSPWTIAMILAAAYLVNAIAIQVLSFANYLLALQVKIGAGRDLQVDLFQHLFSLSMDFFNQERTGEIVARLDQDTKASIAGLETALRNLVVSPLLIAYYGYLMIKTSTQLTLFVAGASLLHYVLTQIVRNPIRTRMREQFNVAAEVTAFLQEKLAGARVVKTFVGEVYEGSRLRKLVDRVMEVNLSYGRLKNVDQPATGSINALTNVGILLFTLNELFSGRLNTTGFFLYLYIGRTILGPITMLTQTYNSIQATLAAGYRVRQLFAMQPGVKTGERVVNEFKQQVVFEDVTFAYQETEVLQAIDFEVKKGETTALVGPSGAGKSTLADLIMRFYDPEEGRILFDGVDLRELDLPAYRRIFGVVAQDNLLFNATVADNIAYAVPETSMEEVEKAARIANAHEFIVELPEGYNTYVGDRGVRLSGGQRQRIAIARAVIRKPEILILDEATSSLDTESERKVQDAIDQIIHTTTAVVIAHRLSTIKEADKIIVLDRGKIIDIGQHDELMVRCELYAHLATLQFGLGEEKGHARLEGTKKAKR